MNTIERLRDEQRRAEKALLEALRREPGREVMAQEVARQAALPPSAVRRALWSLVEREQVQLTKGFKARLPR